MPTIPFGINRKTKKEEHIEIASKLNKYACAVCSQPLIIRDGEEKEKHFAHFRPEEECVLRTKNKYLDGFGDGNAFRGGIRQDFDDWMEYVRAVERGDHELAATLWDFNITSEGKETEQQPETEEKKATLLITEESPPYIALEMNTFNPEPLKIDGSDFSPIKEYKRVAPTSDDLEYVTGQAMIKRIRDDLIAYCPLDKKSIPASRCEGCKFCFDIRQPLMNPDAPHAVLCRGHHELEDDAPESLFDLMQDK